MQPMFPFTEWYFLHKYDFVERICRVLENSISIWQIRFIHDKKTMLFNCKESAMQSFIEYVHYIVLSYILKKLHLFWP